MRARHLISSILLAIGLFAILCRQHIRDLSEVARTYSTFHNYIRLYPDVLMRHTAPHLPHQATDVTLDAPVPRIIHQIFLSSGTSNASLAKYDLAIESCRALHPRWTFNLWTDDNATAFMATFYPEIFPHYAGYAQNIQRANILRYALLQHFGGVYLDLDVTCLVPLDRSIEKGSDHSLTHLPLLTPGAYPAGVNNAFILSRPRHPFLAELLGRVVSRDLHWPMPYVENMLSTGCMFFSNAWMSYVRSERQRRMSDRVYILADDEGRMEPHMLRGKITTPLFEHGGASSWHGWDAAMIVAIGKHYGYFGLALLGVFALAAAGAVVLFSRRKKSFRLSIWRRAISRMKLARRSLEKQHLSRDDEHEVG